MRCKAIKLPPASQIATVTFQPSRWQAKQQKCIRCCFNCFMFQWLLKSLQRSTKQDAWIASEDSCVSQGSHTITVQDLPSICTWFLSSSNACADCLLSTGQSYCWTGSDCHGGWTLCSVQSVQGACLFYLSHGSDSLLRNSSCCPYSACHPHT